MKTHELTRNESLVFDFKATTGWHAIVTRTRAKIRLYVYTCDSDPGAEETGTYDPSDLLFHTWALIDMFPCRTDRGIGNLLINMWTDINHAIELDLQELDLLEHERFNTGK